MEQDKISFSSTSLHSDIKAYSIWSMHHNLHQKKEGMYWLGTHTLSIKIMYVIIQNSDHDLENDARYGEMLFTKSLGASQICTDLIAQWLRIEAQYEMN